MKEKYERKINLYEEVGDDKCYIEYVQHMGTDLTIVNAARVSFGVEKKELDKKDKRLLGYLIKHRHTSTFEHNALTLKFKVPMFVTRQHQRHRTWSFNEESRRYTGENIEFYTPTVFRTQHESNRQASNHEDLSDPIINFQHAEVPASKMLKSFTELAMGLYSEMLDKGICREQARMVLPQNMLTTYIGTVNLNNLIKFIELRIHEGAQWEIIQAAKACLEIASDLWPETISRYREIREL